MGALEDPKFLEHATDTESVANLLVIAWVWEPEVQSDRACFAGGYRNCSGRQGPGPSQNRRQVWDTGWDCHSCRWCYREPGRTQFWTEIIARGGQSRGQHTQGLEVPKRSRRGSWLALSCPHPTFELGVPIGSQNWQC